MDFDEIFNESFEKAILKKNDVKKKIDECRKLVSDKFGDINFVEEGHRYSIGDVEYTPVSNIIKKYEPYVDWDQKAAQNAVKRGLKKEDVQKEWFLNNKKATISGTRTHEFGESYTNLLCGHPELICPQNRPQYIPEYNTLVSTYPKEDAVKKFYDELPKHIHPVGAEFKLSTKYIDGAQPICGTCDLLFYDSERDGYMVYDWKTNKSLINDYNRKYGIMMTGCMSNYIDEAFSHYMLQFNIYQRMLESVDLNIIDRVLVWLKDDGTYETYSMSKIDDKVIDQILKN